VKFLVLYNGRNVLKGEKYNIAVKDSKPSGWIQVTL
jgi:hypothetical protein